MVSGFGGGEQAGLGVKAAVSTVREILRASGIDPTQWWTGPSDPACDIFAVGLLDGTQGYALAVIELTTG